MMDVDIQKAIRLLKSELRNLNKTIGTLEDSLERSVAEKYAKHMKESEQPDNAAAIVLPVPAVLESIPFLTAHLRRMEALRSSDWNVWLQ
jgi:hypothetical protein